MLFFKIKPKTYFWEEKRLCFSATTWTFPCVGSLSKNSVWKLVYILLPFSLVFIGTLLLKYFNRNDPLSK